MWTATDSARVEEYDMITRYVFYIAFAPPGYNTHRVLKKLEAFGGIKKAARRAARLLGRRSARAS